MGTSVNIFSHKIFWMQASINHKLMNEYLKRMQQLTKEQEVSKIIKNQKNVWFIMYYNDKWFWHSTTTWFLKKEAAMLIFHRKEVSSAIFFVSNHYFDTVKSLFGPAVLLILRPQFRRVQIKGGYYCIALIFTWNQFFFINWPN